MRKIEGVHFVMIVSPNKHVRELHKLINCQ